MRFHFFLKADKLKKSTFSLRLRLQHRGRRKLKYKEFEGKRMKKVIRIIIVLVALIFAVAAVLFAKLQIQTRRILTDYSMIYENKK